MREGYNIVAWYLAFAALYILLSDQILHAAVTDPRRLMTISMIKGWMFVLTTGFLLGYLVRRLILKRISREDDLHSLVQTVPDQIWVKDVQGNYLSCNQAFCESIGKTEAELVGHHVDDIVPDDQAQRIAELDRTIVDTGVPIHWVEERTVNGKPAFYSTSKLPIRDSEGKITGILGISRDITEHKVMEETLRQSEQEFRAVVESSPNGILMVDESGKITLINREVERAFGYSRRELVGRPVEVLIPQEQRSAHVLQRDEFGQNPRSRAMDHAKDISGVRKDGSIFPVQVGLTPVKSGSGAFVLATIQDLSDQVSAEEKIRKLALYDNLTALPNRNLFNKQLEAAILQAKAGDYRLSLLAVNLDRFKGINDLLGHGAGDQVLREVAQRLRDSLRDRDFIARVGADDFFVVAPNTSDLAALANKIHETVNRPIIISGQEYRITAGIGIASYPHDSNESGELQRYADMALSTAKEKGPGAFEFYSESLEHRSVRRLALETALRGALERNELSIQFQPIVSLGDCQASGAEALLRWNHPELGFVPPDQFIPIAEETGLILPIGAWVLREACNAAGRWLQAGRELSYISVNLSPRQFHDEKLTETVLAALAESGLKADQLQLEITEGMVVDDPEASTALLCHLKSLGVWLAMDDFGTGYSSLSHLKRFPIDRIKIDRSFIQDTPEDEESAAIVRAIIGLARGLKRTVVAEGVETAEQVAFLDDLGCECIQGYYFSRPLPEKDAEKMCGHVWDSTAWNEALKKAA